MFLKIFCSTEQLREVCPWQRPVRGKNTGYLFSFALYKWSKLQLIYYACLSAYFYLVCFGLLCLGNFHFVLFCLGNFDLILFFRLIKKSEVLGQDINQSTACEICLSFNETASQRLFFTPLSYQSPNHSQQAGLSEEQHSPVVISHFISR